jgi:hypothetical protein
VNEKHLKAAGLALLLALAPGAAKSVELVNTADLTLNLGGRFETLGEMENSSDNSVAPWQEVITPGAIITIPGSGTPGSPSAVTYTTKVQQPATNAITAPGPKRDNTRLYLWGSENRITLNGSLDGTKFYFEQSLGGEAVAASSTNLNLLNLYQYYADVPLSGNTSLVVGQFKVPSSLSSAIDDGSLLFTEKSPLFSTMFNQGYDQGVGIKSHGEGWDATLGTELNSPDSPQRYLPELFVFPPPLYTRFGVGNISDDPYQQVQSLSKLDATQWGLHLNGQYFRNSGAGHSNLLGLQSGDASVVSSDNVYGNVLLWSGWNPFIGKTGTSLATPEDYYWNSSVDAEYRTPLSDDKIFLASAQWSFAQYNNPNMSTTDGANSVCTDISGGELMAGVTGAIWALAARVDMVLPSNNLIYNDTVSAYSTNGVNYIAETSHKNLITGTNPIYEVTFPSITYRFNKYFHVIAETMYFLNSPEAVGNDGVYEVLEMPSQTTNLFGGNSMIHNPFVAVGRMGFILEF